MVWLNGEYLNPFGMIKGPEFFCSLTSWALAAKVIANNNPKSEEAMIFLLVVALLTFLFVTMWFSINFCCKKINLSPRAHVLLGIGHLVFALLLIGASAWVLANPEHWISHWLVKHEVLDINDDISAAGAFGVVCGVLLLVDCVVHICYRHRSVNNGENELQLEVVH